MTSSNAELSATVGPFYDMAALLLWLQVSESGIDACIAADEIIACPLADSAWVFPVWQFTDDREVIPGLLSVWHALRQGADPWTCALWLCAAVDGKLAGRSPVQWLTNGREIHPIWACAHADLERWTR